jgi:hypothetical protein
MRQSLIIVTAILCGFSAKAQVPKVDELNIPTSPAFVLLGKSPANIEKPVNPKALALSLINAGESGGAIEFAPFWLTDQPKYTFDNDVKNHFPFWQTLGFSLASGKDNDSTTISAGFRVQLFRKYSDEADLLATRGKIVMALSSLPVDESAVKALAKELNAKRSKINWNIELAGAYSAFGNTYKEMSGSKAAAWLNIRHTPTVFPIDIVALARYTKTIANEARKIPEASFIDYGLALSKQGADFDVQLEYVNRRDTDLDRTYDRLVFVANYKLMDGIVGVMSFGKDFDEADEVFTAFGIKFSLSKQSVK